jgi:hypothetical protein
MKKIIILFSFLTVLAVIYLFNVNATGNPVNDKSIKEKIKEKYHVYAVPLPDTLDFAGEPVPMQYPYVREKLDKDLLINMYWQSNTLLKIKRAAKYFPIIEPILKKHGIPDDFKFLALAESGLDNVVSPAGAKGIWQLMPETARKYGLIVNKDIDERYHLEKATEAACKYLKEAYLKFGSWTLAAAAYNRGMKGLEKAIADQNETDYYKLYLNDETARYLYRILALKEIINHQRDYGFYVRKQDLYAFPGYKTVEINASEIDWTALAQHHGISYGQLRYMNPWIRSYSYENKNNTVFLVKLPVFK